jgi:transposase-like protein
MDLENIKALASELAKNVKTEKDLNTLTQQLLKMTVETALNNELSEHLGYEKHQLKPKSNARNGYSQEDFAITEIGIKSTGGTTYANDWEIFQF